MPEGVTLHGIANCDTVKKARAWLAAEGAEVTFHDFKRDGFDPKSRRILHRTQIRGDAVRAARAAAHA